MTTAQRCEAPTAAGFRSSSCIRRSTSTAHSPPVTQAHRPTASTSSACAAAAELPGCNGDSGGWIHQTVDLSDLAGQQVLVSFRYMTDGFFNATGFSIDDVKTGSTLISDGSTLTGWQTTSQIHPETIASVNLRLIAYTSDHKRAWVADVPLDVNHHAQLDANRLRRLVGGSATTVAAIVNGYEPGEANPAAIPYQLTINGHIQPGG